MTATARPCTGACASPHKVNDLNTIPVVQGGCLPMLPFEDVEVVLDGQTVRNQTQFPDKLLHRGPGLQGSGLPVHKNFNQSHGFPSPAQGSDRLRRSSAPPQNIVSGGLYGRGLPETPLFRPVSAAPSHGPEPSPTPPPHQPSPGWLRAHPCGAASPPHRISLRHSARLLRLPLQGGVIEFYWKPCAGLKYHSPLEGESVRQGLRPQSNRWGGRNRRERHLGDPARSRAGGESQSPGLVRGPCFTLFDPHDSREARLFDKLCFCMASISHPYDPRQQFQELAIMN